MGFLMKKTGIALLSAAVLAITSAASASSGLFGTAEAADTTNSTYNYGEALQKSMFFYEVQQCGELPDWNESAAVPPETVPSVAVPSSESVPEYVPSTISWQLSIWSP